MAESITLGLSTKMDDGRKIDLQDEHNHQRLLKELLALSDHPNTLEPETKVGIIIRLWKQLVKTCKKTRFVEEVFHTLLRKTALAVLTPLYSEVNLNLRNELVNLIYQYGKILEQVIHGSYQSCVDLARVGKDPWGNAFVEWEPLLEGAVGLEDSNVQTYLKNESREIALSRVHFLSMIGCENNALCLVKYILKYHCKLHGCHVQKGDDSPTNSLNAFSCLEWFLFLLQRKKSLPEIVKITDGLSCHEGVQVLRMLRRRKGCKPLANFLAQVFMVHEILEPKIYCCTKELFRYWCISMKEKNLSLSQVTETTKKLFGQYASSSAHFYLLVDTLWEQFGESFLQLYIELFIRAFTIDINHLDVARSLCKKNEIASLEVQLSNMFMKLSTLFSDSHEQVSRECVLSAFSLRPDEERLLVLQTLTLGILSTQSQNSLWNEDLEMAVDNFHSKEKDPNKIFHPLLIGVEKIPYHLISDLVIVLEGIRCNVFQFNVFDWCNVVTELHDYLNSFVKRNSHRLSFITEGLKSNMRSSTPDNRNANCMQSGSFNKNMFHPFYENQHVERLPCDNTIMVKREQDMLVPWAENTDFSSFKPMPHTDPVEMNPLVAERSKSSNGDIRQNADRFNWHRGSSTTNAIKSEIIDHVTVKKNMLPNLEYTTMALASENKKRLLTAQNWKSNDRVVNCSISCSIVPDKNVSRKSPMLTRPSPTSNAQDHSMQNYLARNNPCEQSPLQVQATSVQITKRESVHHSIQAEEKRQRLSDDLLRSDNVSRNTTSLKQVPLEGLGSPEHFFTSNQVKQGPVSGNNRMNLTEQSGIIYKHQPSIPTSSYIQKPARIMHVYPVGKPGFASTKNTSGAVSNAPSDKEMPNLTAESSNIIPSTTAGVPAAMTERITNAGNKACVNLSLCRAISNNSLSKHHSEPSSQKHKKLTIGSYAKIALEQESNSDFQIPAIKINLPQIKDLPDEVPLEANILFKNRNSECARNQLIDFKNVQQNFLNIPGFIVKRSLMHMGQACTAGSNIPVVRHPTFIGKSPNISYKPMTNLNTQTIIYKVPSKSNASQLSQLIPYAHTKVMAAAAVNNTSVIQASSSQQVAGSSSSRVLSNNIALAVSNNAQTACPTNAMKTIHIHQSAEVISASKSKSDFQKNWAPQSRLERLLSNQQTKEYPNSSLPSQLISAQGQLGATKTSDGNGSQSAYHQGVTSLAISNQHPCSSSNKGLVDSQQHSLVNSNANVHLPFRFARDNCNLECMQTSENIQSGNPTIKKENISLIKSPHLQRVGSMMAPFNLSQRSSPISPLSARMCCSPHELQPCQSCSPTNSKTSSAPSPISSPIPSGIIKRPPQKNVQTEMTSPVAVGNNFFEDCVPSTISSTKKERKKPTWMCDICNKLLGSKYTLKMHKIKIHSDDPNRKSRGRPSLSPNRIAQKDVHGNARENSLSTDNTNGLEIHSMNNTNVHGMHSTDNTNVHGMHSVNDNANLDAKIMKYFTDFVSPVNNDNKMITNSSQVSNISKEQPVERSANLALVGEPCGPAVLSAQLVDEQLNSFSLENDNIQPSSELQTSWQVAGTAMRYLNDPTCDDDFFPEFPTSSLDSLSETEPSFYDNSVDGLNKISYSLNESTVSTNAANKSLHTISTECNISTHNLLPDVASSDTFIENQDFVCDFQKEVSTNHNLVMVPPILNDSPLLREQLNAIDLTASAVSSLNDLSNKGVNCNSGTNFKKPFHALEMQKVFDNSVSSSMSDPTEHMNCQSTTLAECGANLQNISSLPGSVIAVKSTPRSKPKSVACPVCYKILSSNVSRRRHMRCVHQILNFEMGKKVFGRNTPVPTDVEESSLCSSFSTPDSQSEESNQGSTPVVLCPSRKGISAATNSKLSAMLLSHPVKTENTSKFDLLETKELSVHEDERDSQQNIHNSNLATVSALENDALSFSKVQENTPETISSQNSSGHMVPDSTHLSSVTDSASVSKKRMNVQCPMCDKLFCSSASQRRHLKNVHKCVTDEAKEQERKKESEQECLEKVQNILRKISEETQKSEMMAVKKKAKTPQAKTKYNTPTTGVEPAAFKSKETSLEGNSLKLPASMPSSVHVSRTSVISPTSQVVLTSKNGTTTVPLHTYSNQTNSLKGSYMRSAVSPTASVIQPTIIVTTPPSVQQLPVTLQSLKPSTIVALPMSASIPSLLSSAHFSLDRTNIKESTVDPNSFSRALNHPSVTPAQALDSIIISQLQNRNVSIRNTKPPVFSTANRRLLDNNWLAAAQFANQKLHDFSQSSQTGSNFLDVESHNNACTELEGVVNPYLYAEDGKRNPTVENLMRYFEDMEDDVQTLSTLDEPILRHDLSRTSTPSILPITAYTKKVVEDRSNSNLVPDSSALESSFNSKGNSLKHDSAIANDLNLSFIPTSPCSNNQALNLGCKNELSLDDLSLRRCEEEIKGIVPKRKLYASGKSQNDDVNNHIKSGDPILLNIAPNISTHLNLLQSEIVSFQNRSVSVTPIEYASSPVSLSNHQSSTNSISSELDDNRGSPYRSQLSDINTTVSLPILSNMQSPKLGSSSPEPRIDSVEKRTAELQDVLNQSSLKSLPISASSAIVCSGESISSSTCELSSSIEASKNQKYMSASLPYVSLTNFLDVQYYNPTNCSQSKSRDAEHDVPLHPPSGLKEDSNHIQLQNPSIPASSEASGSVTNTNSHPCKRMKISAVKSNSLNRKLSNTEAAEKDGSVSHKEMGSSEQSTVQNKANVHTTCKNILKTSSPEKSHNEPVAIPVIVKANDEQSQLPLIEFQQPDLKVISSSSPISTVSSETAPMPILEPEVKIESCQGIIKNTASEVMKADATNTDNVCHSKTIDTKAKKIPERGRMLTRIQNSKIGLMDTLQKRSLSVDNRQPTTRNTSTKKIIKLDILPKKRLRRRSEADGLTGKLNAGPNSPSVLNLLDKKRPCRDSAREPPSEKSKPPISKCKTRGIKKSYIKSKPVAIPKEGRKRIDQRIKKEPETPTCTNSKALQTGDLKSIVKIEKLSDEDAENDAGQSSEANCPKLVLKKVPVPYSNNSKVGYYVKVKEEASDQAENQKRTLSDWKRGIEKSCRTSSCVVKINRLEIEPNVMVDLELNSAHPKKKAWPNNPVVMLDKPSPKPKNRTSSDISIIKTKRATKKTVTPSRNKMPNCRVMLRKLDEPSRIPSTQKSQRPVRNVTKHIFLNERIFMGPRPLDNNNSSSPAICITLD